MPPLHLICEGILESMIRQCPLSTQELSKSNQVDKQENKLQEHNIEDKVSEEKVTSDDDVVLRNICKESTKWVSIFNDE